MVAKKDNRIEIIRIVAMFLVIMLHVVNRFLFKCSDIHSINYYVLVFVNSITRISVPLFFMISGIVNIPKEFNKKKYVSRVVRMIVVLVVWTLVYYFADNYKLSNLLHAMFSFLKPHLWYMYALIGLYIATPFISKMVKNLDEYEENLFIKLWLILSGIYYLFKIILQNFGVDTNISHPVPLFSATYYLGYYIVGYLIYKNCNKYKNYTLLYICGILCFIANTMLTVYASFKYNTYYQIFFGYSNILIILPSLIFLIIILNKVKDKDYKIVNSICPYTFGIYLSHVLILERLMKYFVISNIFIGFFVYTILTFSISYVLIYIIKKIPRINKYIC